MGSNNFFSKLASYDPLAHALHLPGANNYENQQTRNAINTSTENPGPYTGVAPTLAASQAGYVPGGPGANQWKPFVMPNVGSGWQHFASSMNTDPLAAAVGAPGANSGSTPPIAQGNPAGYVQQSQKFVAPRQVGSAAYGYGGSF
jgi:hypothetical protein